MIISSSSLPVLEDNTINGGGEGTGSQSYGIRIDNASPTIRWNEIDRGTALGDKTAIYCPGGSSPLIDGNTITAGLFGIDNDASSTVIRNNVIIAEGAGYAIRETASSSLIQNNTIRGGNRGIQLVSTSNPTIVNNIIFLTSTTYCIYEADPDAQPAQVRNNNINGWVVYHDHGAASPDKYDVNVEVSTQEGTGWMDTDWDNLKTDPVFADEAGLDWHLSVDSPGSVTEGGMDLSGSFSVQIETENPDQCRGLWEHMSMIEVYLMLPPASQEPSNQIYFNSSKKIPAFHKPSNQVYFNSSKKIPAFHKPSNQVPPSHKLSKHLQERNS